MWIHKYLFVLRYFLAFPLLLLYQVIASQPDICIPERVIPAMQQGPSGLEVRGTEIWVAGNVGQNFNSDGLITRHDLSDNSIDTLLLLELELANFSGLHLQEDTLWAINEEDTLLYKIHAYTGEILDQFTPPYQDRNIWGITGDGTYLYISEYRALNEFTYIYQFDPRTQTTKDTIIVTASRSILGIEYIDGKLYGTGPIELDSLLEIDISTGEVMATYPWCIDAALGIAHDEDSQTFYGVSGSLFGGDTAVYRLTNPLIATETSLIAEPPTLTISPNPVHTQLNIRLGRSSQYTARVYNSGGQLLSTVHFRGNSISLSVQELESGIYFLQVQDAGGVVVSRRFVR